MYGGISNIMIESKRRKAVVTFASIEKATLFVETFRHPMMYAEFTLEKEKRNKLLKALQVRKNT